MARPLCVDMDGTLIATDVLWESVFAMARARPVDLLKLPFWVVKGRAYFKSQVARRGELDVATLPYRNEVIDYLRRERAQGRTLVLATGADQRQAAAVAGHLGLFDEIIASDGHHNMKGEAKRRALAERFGESGFDYMGDSAADLPLWKQSKQAILVCPSQSVLRRANALCTPHKVFESSALGPRGMASALRPRQWAKNLLLLAPLMAAHQVGWDHLHQILQVLLAFVAFCLVASSVYLLNDLLDLQSDRRHPTKRHRPLASGRLSIPHGIGLGLILVAGGVGLSTWLMTPVFTMLLLVYLILTTAYSVYFKRKMMLDVIVLAGLYTHRIVAGGVAADVPPSPWLMAFAMFLFLSLAFAKRYTELLTVKDPRGRGYIAADLEVIRSVGPASGYLCVLVLALYINSGDVTKLYQRPEILWLLCPILLYWITRIWFLAHRARLDDDPVLFAMKDAVSYLSAAAALGVIVAASM